MAGASKLGAETAMTQANAPRGALAGQRQAPSQQKAAQRIARFKKPSRNVGKSLPERNKPRLPVPPKANTNRAQGLARPYRTFGAEDRRTGEARTAARGAATRRKSVPMVVARQDPTKNQELADRRATQNLLQIGEGAAGPQKGALAANRDAPCALSAAG